ncbi:MAG: hypothetical protein HY998_04970 [candidate division NC10 bacterium]|nr:hypothetical protein [candidate division NC10 bacterium]
MENLNKSKKTFTIELDGGTLRVLKDGVEEPQVACFFGYMRKDGDIMVLTPWPIGHALAPIMSAIFLKEPALLHLLFDFFLDLAREDFERWRAEKLKQKSGVGGYGFYF